MITEADLERNKDKRIVRLDALAKACATATNNDFKTMWYLKLHKLGTQYGLMNHVRKLIH